MAEFSFSIPQEITQQLSKHLSKIDDVAPKMLEEAAPLVVSALQSKVHKRTGKLSNGIKAKKAKKSKNGAWIIPIVFSGKENRKKKDGTSIEVPNVVKAMVEEFGSSKQPAKPFIRPAVAESEDKVLEKMREVYNREMSE